MSRAARPVKHLGANAGTGALAASCPVHGRCRRVAYGRELLGRRPYLVGPTKRVVPMTITTQPATRTTRLSPSHHATAPFDPDPSQGR